VPPSSPATVPDSSRRSFTAAAMTSLLNLKSACRSASCAPSAPPHQQRGRDHPSPQHKQPHGRTRRPGAGPRRLVRSGRGAAKCAACLSLKKGMIGPCVPGRCVGVVVVDPALCFVQCLGASDRQQFWRHPTWRGLLTIAGWRLIASNDGAHPLVDVVRLISGGGVASRGRMTAQRGSGVVCSGSRERGSHRRSGTRGDE
jgi:hypothetical protein